MPRPGHEPPLHPGQVLLRSYLRPLGIRQLELADHIGLKPAEMSRFVNGKRELSARLAWSLSDALGTAPRFWMLRQVDYDLWRGRPERRLKRMKAVLRRPRRGRSTR
jgi:addiction module HigA family antidote